MIRKFLTFFFCVMLLVFGLLPVLLPAAADLINDPSTVGCGKNIQNTAIGCIPIGTGSEKLPTGMLNFLLQWAFGISGGIIILMLILTGFSLATSSGNPEKLQAAKENLVSIFSGFILIVFSVVLLRTIGVDILKLPTF